MLDRQPTTTAPKTEMKAPQSEAERRVLKKKDYVLRSGNWRFWPTKGEQNGWRN